jgi:hypothetical protein
MAVTTSSEARCGWLAPVAHAVAHGAHFLEPVDQALFGHEAADVVLRGADGAAWAPGRQQEDDRLSHFMGAEVSGPADARSQAKYAFQVLDLYRFRNSSVGSDGLGNNGVFAMSGGFSLSLHRRSGAG